MRSLGIAQTLLANTAVAASVEAEDVDRVAVLAPRAWRKSFGYPQPELSRVPDASAESFGPLINRSR